MSILTTNFALRNDFPLLSQNANGHRLAYLDNGATTQKPLSVIETINRYYSEENSNIHRGVYTLSQNATTAYEEVREKVQEFIKAKHPEEIIFTSGTTDGLNLLAYSYALKELSPGDEIILTHMEHHANIVPWQIIAEKNQAVIKVVDLTPEGKLDLDHYHSLLSNKTKIVSITYVSNSLGTINPVKEIIQQAHQVGAIVILDAAQAVAHLPINVVDLDCDFLVFSGHKLFAPTGTGVLYGKKALLEKMPPFKGGGDMILKVSFKKTIYNELPHKFEAGTPHVGGVIGLGAAIDYVEKVGFSQIENNEKKLLEWTHQVLKSHPQVRIIGDNLDKIALFSFVLDGIHPHDAGTILDQCGVAVRVGHHCTQPAMDFFKVPGTIRASLSFYNDQEDINQLKKGLDKIIEVLT